jgi:uncharacterized protein
MQKIDDRIVFSPSDLNQFLECGYLTRLDLEAAHGRRRLEKRRSGEADLLAAKGEAHERAQLEQFRREGRSVAEVPDPEESDWQAAGAASRQAMAAGADVIYQAVLLADGWRGRADFLIKVDTPSALGGWSYEVWDTKLARHARPSHVLQLAYYTERVAAIQQSQPEWMHVVLGNGERLSFRCRDFAAYYRRVRSRFLAAIDRPGEAAPYPVAHCALCGYADHCEACWHDADHLSLVASIRRSQVDRLVDAGVTTGAALAASSGAVEGIGDSTLARHRHQASLQAHYRTTGEHRYELLPPDEEHGFRLLPPPSIGDVFFDMEGFPFFEPAAGLEYLFGAVGADQAFEAFRALTRAEEKRAFEQFIDFVWDRLRRWPDLHVYHYSHYEPTALKRLMAQHATREEEVDELLRRDAFVDLYQVVRRALRISHDSYSIKAVREFFMPEAGQGAVTGGAQSVLEFQRWLDTGDPAILEAIERYNEEDCVSTLKLRDWLLGLKREAEATLGLAMPFAPLPDRRSAPVVVEPDAHAGLRAQLAALPHPSAATLAHLLDYHRREAKPEWWAYFARRKKSADELLDDTEAIAYLTPAAEPPATKQQSLVYTMAFRAQEFKLKADADVEAPLGAGRAGTIEWLDAGAARLGLRRGKRRAGEPLPVALIAGGPVPDQAQRDAIVRVATAAAAGRSRYRAVSDILRADRPRFAPAYDGVIQTLDLEAQSRLVAALDDSYLLIQGPPGSGKTWTGARLIVSLLRQGRRVGVTAPNHRAIHNLLEEVERVALAEDVPFTGVKKRSTSDETAFNGRFITSVSKPEECDQSDAQLIAGTAWQFARAGMDGSLDYLVVDEAGQFALADGIAVGTAARNIILLGDPQQLPHVTQNAHPGRSGCSVLGHLLGEAATVPADRGIFLAQSWRMHPAICAFVSDHSYDGRLRAAPGCDRQVVWSHGLSGSGLRFVAVDHRGNAQQSEDEARAVAIEVRRLLQGGTVTDRDGQVRPLTSADILVVAPYNMQVRCLRDALPRDIEVGTVDKFQGREAAVVFFSMASSSGDEVPRGLEFLFNHHRFNVAISRARCLSVVVASPRLLEAPCRTVDQMRLINALCRFVEVAAPPALVAPAVGGGA